MGWESCFGEESGLPFIPTHFSSLYFTHTLTHTLLTLAAAATLWSAPHFARAARFRIGIRAERSTPRKLGHFDHFTHAQDTLGHGALPYFLPSRLECEILEYFLVLTILTFLTLFCCCCYAMERTSFSGAARFRAGTRAEWSTPQKLGESSAKAPRKLRGSSAHPQPCSTLQGVVVVIPSILRLL